MSSDTSEKALEACIERFLTGDVSTPAPNDGRAREDPAAYQAGKGVGYLCGRSSDFNPEFALDEAKFWQFLEATQADELAKLHYKPDYRCQILERLHRKLKKDGILSVLKKGLDVDNGHFKRLRVLQRELVRFRSRLRVSIRQTVSVIFIPVAA